MRLPKTISFSLYKVGGYVIGVFLLCCAIVQSVIFYFKESIFVLFGIGDFSKIDELSVLTLGIFGLARLCSNILLILVARTGVTRGAMIAILLAESGGWALAMLVLRTQFEVGAEFILASGFLLSALTVAVISIYWLVQRMRADSISVG